MENEFNLELSTLKILLATFTNKMDLTSQEEFATTIALWSHRLTKDKLLTEKEIKEELHSYFQATKDLKPS